MNTEFIQKTVKHYSPVVLRGSLWVSIAVLSDLRHSISDFIAKPDETSWLQWSDAVVGALLAGAIALRLFLDQTLTHWRQEHSVKA